MMPAQSYGIDDDGLSIDQVEFRIGYFVDQARVHMIMEILLDPLDPLNLSAWHHSMQGWLFIMVSSASAVHATSQTMGCSVNGD